MKTIYLQQLSQQDASRLLEFEQTNRQWFEQYIAPRKESFYCLQGVEKHIDECLQWVSERKMYPTLIISSEGVILGRVNLHKIDHLNHHADIGYRVAKSACGQGIASLAVEKILVHAFNQLNLQTLYANVLDNNPASKRILEKFGFQLFSQISEPVLVHKKTYLGSQLKLDKQHWASAHF